jgi:leader peptidase (prepilin peptidase)/N-methyltransferase
MVAFYLFVFGTIIGSFLNVCIFRLPKDQDIVVKKSSCQNCKKQIFWYENIPLISYLFLLGRCSKCKKFISAQYPIVELLTGFLFFHTHLHYGLSLETLFVVLFYIALIIIFFTDFNEYLILDIITLPMFALGIAISFFQINPFSIRIFESLIGSLVGFLILYLIRWFYLKFRGIEGMGLGDAKLLLFLGAWLGIKSIIFILLLSAVTALFVAIPIVVIKKNKNYPIPYGCFIVFASFLYPIIGDTLYKFLS